MTLTTHPHLVSRSRMSRSYTLLFPQAPPWHVAGRLFSRFISRLDRLFRLTKQYITAFIYLKVAESNVSSKGARFTRTLPSSFFLCVCRLFLFTLRLRLTDVIDRSRCYHVSLEPILLLPRNYLGHVTPELILLVSQSLYLVGGFGLYIETVNPLQCLAMMDVFWAS
jgi:hypothetical protein